MGVKRNNYCTSELGVQKLNLVSTLYHTVFSAGADVYKPVTGILH